MVIGLSIVIALLMDRILGEASHTWHPLVWFGNAAIWWEKQWNNVPHQPSRSLFFGVTGVLILVAMPVIALSLVLTWLPFWLNLLVQIWVLYFCIGWQSLREHGLAIFRPLVQGEIQIARQSLAMIVSRDTTQLSERQIAKATTESLLENGNDALFASIFWFVLFGAMGALAHRLINTLDSMWGYRTERFEYFGKFPAKLDDLLNYAPARLTAFSYALVGQCRMGLACWRRQAAKHDSPNAGVVMATGAGALGVRLGGSAYYHGQKERRPVFGLGKSADHQTISKTIMLFE